MGGASWTLLKTLLQATIWLGYKTSYLDMNPSYQKLKRLSPSFAHLCLISVM